MFDFDGHAEKAEIRYRRVQQDFADLAKEVRRILEVTLKDVKVHEFQHRAKTVESFVKKALKPIDDNSTDPKYPNPLEDITDLAGVRVITFFPKTLEVVEERLVSADFKIIERRNIGDERFKAGKFGYQSIHFLVELPENRKILLENQRFKDLVCEIQVRTIMQHAWAEMEHDIQYKSTSDIPINLRRRFLALAGMIDIADREFQAIQDEDAELRLSLKASLEDSITESFDDSNSSGTDSGTRSSNGDGEPTVNYRSARELVAAGQYAEAVELYNQKINFQPNNHLLFAGRAKARFLNGDTKGSLDDIGIAIERVPDDPRLKQLRTRLLEGMEPRPYVSFWDPFNKACEFLAQGLAEEAFAHFSKAQELGYNYALASFHKSMSRILSNDCDGATFFLDQLKIYSDRPMAANILGLKAIIAASCNQRTTSAFKSLEGFLADEKNAMMFEYAQSPLRWLEQGIKARDGQIKPTIEKVFSLLRTGRNMGAA